MKDLKYVCVFMEEAVSEDMTAHADRRTEGAVQKGARPAQTQQRQKQRQGGKKQRKKNLRPKARLQRCHLNFNMLKRSLDGTGNMRANIHKAT